MPTRCDRIGVNSDRAVAPPGGLGRGRERPAVHCAGVGEGRVRLRSTLVATDRDIDDDPGERLSARGGPRGGPLDGRRSWAPGGRGQGPVPPPEAGDDGAAIDRTTRLIEALATVLGRRLDVIETRLNELVAPSGPGAPGDGSALGVRLDRLDQRLDELITAADQGPGAAASVGGADRALRQILVRLDTLESRLAATGPEATAEGALARVEARLDQLNRLLLG